jgi:hypothetical protein
MKHAARIFLLLSSTLLLAYYLPIAWRVLTARRAPSILVHYSDTARDFLILRYDFNTTTRDVKLRYTDTAGREYERDAYEQMLPHIFYMQLEKNGSMPVEINGAPVTLSAIRREMFSYRIRPAELDAPGIALHTVFETAGGRARLEMPSDYMRIRDDGRIEFIDSKTNKILPAKSALFTETFAAKKFAFPLTALGSNPSTHKPYDEGIYIADAHGRTYLLRQALGAPILERLETLSDDPAAWRALRPKHIIVDELETREIHALIIDTDGHPWLSTGKNHTLRKLPVTTYDPAATSLTIRGSILNRLILVQGSDKLEAVALDRNYAPVNRYEETFPSSGQKPAAKIAATLFPFTWWLNDTSSSYYNFHTQLGAASALALNAVLLIIYILILFKRARKPKAPAQDRAATVAPATNLQATNPPATVLPTTNPPAAVLPKSRFLVHIPELLAIALCGFCAFIPALLLPRAD